MSAVHLSLRPGDNFCSSHATLERVSELDAFMHGHGPHGWKAPSERRDTMINYMI
jgi:hypothetical protein